MGDGTFSVIAPKTAKTKKNELPTNIYSFVSYTFLKNLFVLHLFPFIKNKNINLLLSILFFLNLHLPLVRREKGFESASGPEKNYKNMINLLLITINIILIIN